MSEMKCKLLVIGAGPGGYVCAIRAGQLGIDTIIVESAKAGGTCLNVGCIPSKAIIHGADDYHKLVEAAEDKTGIGITASKPALDLKKMMRWKDSIVSKLNVGVGGLLKKANVKLVEGHAELIDGKTAKVKIKGGEVTILAEKVVIATGSKPIELPNLPFGDLVCSSTGLLALNKVPEKLVIVGGGYIGLELGTAFAKLGSKVTIVEATDKLLPQYDAELVKPVANRLKALGVEVLTSTKAEKLDAKGKGLVVTTKSGKKKTLAADKIAVTVGRAPVTQNIGLENVAIDQDGPFIKIDERCHTSMRDVYAIGDVTGEPMLAHRGMAQGEMVAEIIAGENRSWDKQCIPAICFTDPEIVCVGLSPDEAKDEGYDAAVSSFPFQANGRAMTTQREDGFVRIVSRKDNNQVLGIQAVGEGISEMSASFALAIEMGACLEDIAGTIHAHPTKGEALQEASLKALGHALHI